MFKTALMMAGVLAVASPTRATVALTTAGSASAVSAALAVPVTDLAYAHSWVSPAWGKLIVASEPDMAAAMMEGDAGRAVAPVRIAAMLPEPLSWVTIALGLALIGWLARGRGRDAPVSFV